MFLEFKFDNLDLSSFKVDNGGQIPFSFQEISAKANPFVKDMRTESARISH